MKSQTITTLIQVDNEDADLLTSRWHLHNGYAARGIADEDTGSGRRLIKLHRLVMARVLGRQLVRGELVDHVNGRRTDNRRDNLRIADASQNLFNLGMKGGTSEYAGVTRDKSRGLWKTEIRAYGKGFHIGRFKDELEAAWMHDQYALELHGEFASLNFDYQ